MISHGRITANSAHDSPENPAPWTRSKMVFSSFLINIKDLQPESCIGDGSYYWKVISSYILSNCNFSLRREIKIPRFGNKACTSSFSWRYRRRPGEDKNTCIRNKHRSMQGASRYVLGIIFADRYSNKGLSKVKTNRPINTSMLAVLKLIQ